jgi:DNA-binding IclR family transcriptional regulator
MTKHDLQCVAQACADHMAGPGADFSAEILSSSQLRILAIYAKVLSDGPISVSHVARLLGLPKSSVSRAITKLERVNWVQKRPSDGAVQVSAHFKELINKASTYDLAWDRIIAKLSPLADKLGFGFELVVINSDGELETVGYSDVALGKQSGPHDKYSELRAASMARYGAAVDDEPEANAIDTVNSASLEEYARFRQYLQEFQKKGAVWDEKKRSYIRAMSMPSGESGALRILQGAAVSLQECVTLCEQEVLNITIQPKS